MNVVRLLISLALISTSNAADQTVGLWGRFETAVTNNKSYSNHFNDVVLNAVFTSPSKKIYNFFGFYDGDGNGGQNIYILWKFLSLRYY